MISYGDTVSNLLDLAAFILAAPWFVGRDRTRIVYEKTLAALRKAHTTPTWSPGLSLSAIIINIILLMLVLLFVIALTLPWTFSLVAWAWTAYAFFVCLTLFFCFSFAFLLVHFSVQRSGFATTMVGLAALFFLLARIVALGKAAGFYP